MGLDEGSGDQPWPCELPVAGVEPVMSCEGEMGARVVPSLIGLDV
jgi:hypothetical protein